MKISRLAYRLTLVLLLAPFLGLTQSSSKILDIGLQAQQYPTGFIFTGYGDLGWVGRQAVEFRLGYNTFDHESFGVQDEETGSGIGFSLGYKYYFKDGFRAWYLGARSDVWFSAVDWRDHFAGGAVGGTSKITVIQPTAFAGYRLMLGDRWVLSPEVAFGAEINVVTKGEKVGQGPILLWGLQLAYRIQK